MQRCQNVAPLRWSVEGEASQPYNNLLTTYFAKHKQRALYMQYYPPCLYRVTTSVQKMKASSVKTQEGELELS